MILLTGSSGFLGQTIKNVLRDHEIISIGRSKADIIADIGKEVPVLPICNIVVHVAGKAHFIPKTKIECQRFFEINVTGTANILNALEKNKPKSFVFISSVSVYGLESGKLITEDSPLTAKDPYGRSKVEAENIVQKWCERNNVTCTILRLPLIAGPNPPGNLRSMINGIKKGYYFNIDGGTAKKSIVLATDVAQIIPIVAKIGGVYNLTDQYHPNFLELSQYIAQQLDKPKPFDIPKWVAVLMAKAGDLFGSKAPINSKKLSKITSDLTFDDSKASSSFGWNPTPVLKGFKIK